MINRKAFRIAQVPLCRSRFKEHFLATRTKLSIPRFKYVNPWSIPVSDFRQDFSSSVEANNGLSEVDPEIEIVENLSNADNPLSIERYGPEDGTITVKVGNKSFQTLKSTIQLSPTMWKLYQTNLHSDHMFLDRDPEHFPIILEYLRNKADNIHYDGSFLGQDEPLYVKLPDLDWGGDEKKPEYNMEGLYMEASYYQLEEIKTQVTNKKLMAQVMFYLSKTTNENPFALLRKFYALRNQLGFLTVFGIPAVQFSDDLLSACKKFFDIIF